MKNLPILICDDNTHYLNAAKLTFQTDFEVHTSHSIAHSKTLLGKFQYFAAIVDLHFDEHENGTHILDHALKQQPAIKLFALTGHTDVKLAVSATQRRLYDFVHKDGTEFSNLLKRLNELHKQDFESDTLKHQIYPTVSPKMRTVLDQLDKMLKFPEPVPILITGESGTGKEKLSQYISKKLKQRLVVANMTTIPKETAESELFGHVQGAFTGANKNQTGLIESAHGGIFFMDEIGDASLDIQAKLLRTIQEKQLKPVGSTQTKSIDVRFISATHKNIKEMVQNQAFRLDLFQRISPFTLHVPALRERPEDILFYANHYLREYQNPNMILTFSPESEQELLHYDWPGNIRELKALCQKLIVFQTNKVISRESVLTQLTHNNFAPQNGNEDGKLNRLREALSYTHGNRRAAAKVLGISEATLYRWLNKSSQRNAPSHLKL